MEHDVNVLVGVFYFVISHSILNMLYSLFIHIEFIYNGVQGLRYSHYSAERVEALPEGRRGCVVESVISSGADCLTLS